MQVAAASNPKKDFAFTIGTLTELGQKATGGRLRAMARGSVPPAQGQLLPKMCLITVAPPGHGAQKDVWEVQ